jgi:hypothetical protein
MRKYFFSLIVLLVILLPYSKAQYYYKDILSAKQAMAGNALLKQQKIRNILVHSFESDATESKDFTCKRKISKDYRSVETYTQSPSTGESWLTSLYDEKGQLLLSSDSSEITVSTSVYRYDGKGNIVSIISTAHSSDSDFTTSHIEEHRYSYTEKGMPINLWRIKNNSDSVLIDFLVDEKGNVTDEIEPGKHGKHYYYYYNADNKLTDIVKYNIVKKMLLPDFSFEYDDEGQVEQMIAVEEGVSGEYYTWRYVYNNGLRIIEKCFDRKRRLIGYFEYEYD